MHGAQHKKELELKSISDHLSVHPGRRKRRFLAPSLSESSFSLLLFSPPFGVCC
jgi:hypothetical protein